MKFTRRELPAVLVPATASFAQTPTPAGPAEEMKAAQGRLKTASDALARQQMPMDTEPAFQFKA